MTKNKCTVTGFNDGKGTDDVVSGFVLLTGDSIISVVRMGQDNSMVLVDPAVILSQVSEGGVANITLRPMVPFSEDGLATFNPNNILADFGVSRSILTAYQEFSSRISAARSGIVMPEKTLLS